MSANQRPLADGRLFEAGQLLRLNQQLRASATWTLIAAFVVAAAGTIAAILARDLAVLLPLPAVTTMLCSLGFQQFAEVSVVGTARRHLEQIVNAELSGQALVYETAVARIRQRLPLVASVRLLQAVWATSLLALLIAASRVAYGSGYEAWVPLAYSALTAAAVVSAVASYRAMLRSDREADAALASAIPIPERQP